MFVKLILCLFTLFLLKEMFHIVEFCETQEVEVVPSVWVNDDVCQWLTHYQSDELAKAIRGDEEPGQSWEELRVRILYTAGIHITYLLKFSHFKNTYTTNNDV